MFLGRQFTKKNQAANLHQDRKIKLEGKETDEYMQEKNKYPIKGLKVFLNTFLRSFIYEN